MVTVLAFVDRDGHRRHPDRRRRPADAGRRRTTSSRTRGTPSRYGFAGRLERLRRAVPGRDLQPAPRPSKGTLAGYVGPISETLTNATPLILGGLSVGLAFRAGLFNIGGQGQVIMGAICAGFVGFHWHLPPGLHLLLARPRRHARRRAVGRPRRLPQGQDRRARGDHHDHAQLHRALLPGLPAVGQGLPGAAVRPGDLQPGASTARSCRRCSAPASASTPA